MQSPTVSPSSRLFLALLAMFTLTAGVHADDELWATLTEGGKVILIRHAPVERGPDAGNPLIRDPSCKQERNLSDAGQSDARELGEKFRTRGIPIERVFYSPFCRTTETARLAFKDASPQNYLSLLEILGAADAADQTEELNSVIGSFSGDGNLVLVTHEPNINAVSFETVKHLDLVVLEPMGNGEFDELGVIRFSSSK